MKKTMIVGALGALLCAAAGAQAQTAEPVQKPITIKLGVFLPSNGDVKDVLGKTWFSAGADYAFNKQGDTQNVMPLAYVDYAGSNKNGVKANFIGVGAGVRYYTSPPGTSSTTPYVGAGVGAYFIHASGGGDSTNNTRIGGKINLGVEFQQMYLVEANYTYAGKVSGTTLDGFGIQAGVRF